MSDFMETDFISEKLEKLTKLGGVSSDEWTFSQFLLSELSKLADDCIIDKYGNALGRINSSEPAAPTLLLDAHMDRIGLVITNIEADGRLKFETVGGIDLRILPYKTVLIGEGKIEGMIVPKDSGCTDAYKLENMRIDIGMSYDNVQKKVNIGDTAVIFSEYHRLCNSIASCGAMDNRASICAILDAIENIDRDKLKYNLIIMFSAEEELGLHGAYNLSEQYMPDAALIIDVTHGKTPDTADVTGVFELGCGAVICRGPSLDYNLSLGLVEIAKKNDVKYEIETASGHPGTNAWAFHMCGAGIPSAMISIPLKYMHTNVETLDLNDIQAVSRLLKLSLEGGIILDK